MLTTESLFLMHGIGMMRFPCLLIRVHVGKSVIENKPFIQ